jgi:hypothetical protein
LRDVQLALAREYGLEGWAVVCGELVEVERRLAIDAGACSIAAGPRRWQPLQYLCYARLPLATAKEQAVAIDIAELLLAHGAAAQFTDKEGKTPAELAAQQGLEDLAEFLRGP